MYDQNELPLVDRLLDLYRNLFSDGTEGRNDAGPFGVGQSTNDARAMQGEFAHLALKRNRQQGSGICCRLHDFI